MPDASAILLAKYTEHRIQARQHESLRTALVTFTAAAAGAVLSFAGAKDTQIEFQLAAAAFLFMLGIFAAFMAYKHYERFRYHSMLGTEYDRRLRGIADSIVDLDNYDFLMKAHIERFGHIAKARAYIGWVLFPLLVSLLGGTLFVLRLLSLPTPAYLARELVIWLAASKGPSMNTWTEVLKIISPFGAALLAYLLGSRAYFRQKEFELIRSRYLEGCLDRVAAQTEETLSTITHNFLHAIKILRVFRDVGPAPAARMSDGFKSLDSGPLELVAITRLHELAKDQIFWDVRQLLYSSGQEYHAFLKNEMCEAMNRFAGGAALNPTKEEIQKIYEEKVVQGYLNANRFTLLISCLHEIAAAFQAQRLTLSSLREFHKQRVVSDAAKRLRDAFGEEIKPLDQELQKMGIVPKAR